MDAIIVKYVFSIYGQYQKNVKNCPTLTVFHIFSIYGQHLEIVQHWLSLVHNFSICGKYLETVQELINSMFSEYHKVRKLENMGLTWPCDSQLGPIYGPCYWFGKGLGSDLQSWLKLLGQFPLLPLPPLQC